MSPKDTGSDGTPSGADDPERLSRPSWWRRILGRIAGADDEGLSGSEMSRGLSSDHSPHHGLPSIFSSMADAGDKPNRSAPPETSSSPTRTAQPPQPSEASQATQERSRRLAEESDLTSRKDQSAIESEIQRLLENGEPADDTPIFCFLRIADEGLLTIEGGSSPALVIFSPPARSGPYAAFLADLKEKEQTPSAFALPDWPELGQACHAAGVRSFTLNPNPRGNLARIFSTDSAGTEDGLRDIWLTDTATRNVLFTRKLQEAEAAHRAGDRRECLRVCQDIVQHIDDQRPEAYLLLGRSAHADDDEAMLRYAREQLRGFDSSWSTRLDAGLRQAKA